MGFKNENIEVKVGLFVVLALAMLAFLVIKSGDFYWKPGYNVRLIFNNAGGITEGSAVCLSGVPIGEVKSIKVVRTPIGQTQIEVMARIAEGVMIEEDSDVRVSASGLLGEKFIQISPGAGNTRVIHSDETLIGQGSANIADLADQGNRLLTRMSQTVDTISRILTEPKFQDDIKGTFNNTHEVSKKLVVVGDNASQISKNLLEASEDLKVAAKSARSILERVQSGQGTVGRLLKDDKIALNFESFSEDIKKYPWKLLKRY